MENTVKHYIRLDENKSIIHGFSTTFEEPLETDICINDNGGRHFEVNGVINPQLKNENGIPLFKYHYKKVVERSTEEKQPELEAILSAPKPLSETEKLWETVTYLINDGYTT